MADTVGKRIADQRRKLGLSQSALARSVGLKPQSLQAIEAGGGTKHILKFAEALGVSPHWLETGEGEPGGGKQASLPASNVGTPVIPPNIGSAPQDVPVMGNAVGGMDGYLEMNNGDPVDYVRRPPGVANNRRVYAIYVVGDSMEPAYDAGDLVYVDPTRPVQVGRDVVVQLLAEEPGQPPRAYVKRFVKMTPSKIVVRQFNPDREIAFSRDAVMSLHYVMKAQEVLGI